MFGNKGKWSVLTGCLVVFIMLLMYGCGKKDEISEEPKPVPDYYSMIKSVNKLTLAEMTISKMGSVEDLKFEEAKGSRQKFEAVLNSLKIGTRKGAFSYNTYLQAYMNLDEMKPGDVEIDTALRVMRIRLPEIHTEFVGRDIEIREDHYRVSGLRSHINPEERARIKEAMNANLKKEVEENGSYCEHLKEVGLEKAKAYFTAFGSENGYEVEF